ncbi:MAG: iron ABC transporter permease, partial [Chloroflexi bacterium]|nr:iron ABC transporter permease [Chloroflexota bacterium]
PLMLPGLVAGWVIVFVHIVGEVTASAMIAGVGNAVVGPLLLDLWENGTFPQLAALALILSLLNTTVVLAVLRFARGSFNARVS